VVTVWGSRRWTTRDKLIGTLGGLSWWVAPLGTIGISAGGSGLGPAEVIVFVVPFLLPIAAVIYLGIRLRAHPSMVPADEPAEQTTPLLAVITLVALLIPFLGWVVGMVLLWLSPSWTTRDKRIGTLLALGVGLLALAALASPLEWIRPLLVMVLTIPSVIYLGIRLRAHTGAMPATG
jgi:hypothetical protein